EVLVTGPDVRGDHHLTAQALEGLGEVLAQGDRVVLGDVGDDRHPPGAQVLVGELRGDLCLVVVGEAGPEDVGPPLGDEGVGGGGTDDGDAGLLRDGSGRQGVTAGHGADDGHHTLVNEAGGRVGRL